MSVALNDIWQAMGILFALAGLWWRLQSQITANARALDAYKLEVTEKYASVKHLREVEARLVISIDRLTERIDRLLSRIDKMRERART